MDGDGLKTRDRKLALGEAVPSDWTWAERLCQRCRRRRCCPWLSADISTLFSPSLLLFFLRSALMDSAQRSVSDVNRSMQGASISPSLNRITHCYSCILVIVV